MNIQHITLNDIAQLAKMGMAIGIGISFAQKGHNLMDHNGLVLSFNAIITACECCEWVTIFR